VRQQAHVASIGFSMLTGIVHLDSGPLRAAIRRRKKDINILRKLLSAFFFFNPFFHNIVDGNWLLIEK